MRLVCKSISFIFEGDMEEPRACKWYANILIINIKDKKETCFNKKTSIAILMPGQLIRYVFCSRYRLSLDNFGAPKKYNKV